MVDRTVYSSAKVMFPLLMGVASMRANIPNRNRCDSMMWNPALLRETCNVPGEVTGTPAEVAGARRSSTQLTAGGSAQAVFEQQDPAVGTAHTGHLP